jgi:hypothetical protein
MGAALRGHIFIVQILLEAGAQRNTVDKVSVVTASPLLTLWVLILLINYRSGGARLLSWLKLPRSRPSLPTTVWRALCVTATSL